MLKKTYVDIDVVTMAKIRIKNVFKTAPRIQFSTSGGKDSACLSNLLYEMCLSGEIDKSKLTVRFIDEEAIYPCIERCVKNWRLKWLSIGVKFDWYCLQFKHFSCFNQLTQEESFILWEEGKPWIREMPKFAIKSHPLLKPRVDRYQQFLERLDKVEGNVALTGVRVAESLQRLNSLASVKKETTVYPIMDWSDNDVWKYIKEKNIEIPEAYMYMYQVGLGKREMRISQFFSVDTAKSLVRMCEFYPELYDKICKREPNAYLAMLYFDTELFRRSKEKGTGYKDDEVDWKAKFFEYYNDPSHFLTKLQKDNRRTITNILLHFSLYMTQKEYKVAYNTLVGGDPKNRTLRSIYVACAQNKAKELKEKK